MKRTKPQATNWQQIDRFLQSAQRKLQTAARILEFDEEACLQQAYEAMLRASLAFMFSHGTRVRSQPGHHIAIIEFVEQRLDKKHAPLLTLFDQLRRKRNQAIYDDRGFVSRHEGEEAIAAAGTYLAVIRTEIDLRRPP